MTLRLAFLVRGLGAAALLALAALPAHAVDPAAIAASRPPAALTAFGFFEDAAATRPAPGVVAYDIAAPLFTDYAEKARFIYTPTPVRAAPEGVLDLPVGSALIKTFHYGDRKVETRVLVRQADGWKAWPYLWNDTGTEATLKIAGANLNIETPRGTIAYRVPNMNQCKACHTGSDAAVRPIGPKLRNLNTGDQLARLAAANILRDLPADPPATPAYDDPAVDLTDRARAYLDANCGHCHAPGHPADTSGLYLNWEESRPLHLGIGKRPVAAGRGSGGLRVDIAPGDPDASILLYRMDSADPGVMMPEIGRGMIHAEGVLLIRDWIAALD